MSRNLGCMINYQALIDDPVEFQPIIVEYFKQKLLKNANDQFQDFIVKKTNDINETNVFKLIDRWLQTKQKYYDLKKQ